MARFSGTSPSLIAMWMTNTIKNGASRRRRRQTDLVVLRPSAAWIS
jgi:hypothetical protein